MRTLMVVNFCRVVRSARMGDPPFSFSGKHALLPQGRVARGVWFPRDDDVSMFITTLDGDA
jgi:hypothetical protein